MQWHSTFGSLGDDGYGRLAVDSSGAILMTARTASTIDYGGGPLAHAGGLDMPVVKLAPDGAHVWSRLVRGAQDQRGKAVALGPGGEVYVGGEAAGVTDVAEGDLYPAGGFDLLIARLGR